MSSQRFTPDQQTAIATRGNTLVVAGAGAGKTGTLVARCLRLLVEERVSVSKILVVTFTEAAAAEVRERIRAKLDAAALAEGANDWVIEQVARLDAAHICTLHSFCLALLRENFYALDLDPTVTVLSGEQAEMLFWEVFEEVLDEHFAGQHEFSGRLQEVLRTHFGGWDKPLREFIRKLHHYTQTRPGPDEWFAEQIALLETDGTALWRKWYEQAAADWCAWWAPYLASLPAENENGQYCAAVLQAALKTHDPGVVATVLARKDCWNKRKGKDAPAFGNFFDEAEFLDSLREKEALEQDWKWNAAPLLVLLKFARQFSERYGEAKRARGAVDFHDLEQGAVQLLWDAKTQRPTTIAERWQARLEAVFVDEYQDINAAQDLILNAVSRGENGDGSGNRFLVGDIKQSIYGFRQADPSIFRSYLDRAMTGGGWNPVFLSDNFRSHEGILHFINPLFGWLMQERVGGVMYDAQAALKYGAPEVRPELRLRSGELWPVELHVLLGSNTENEEEEDEDLEAAEMEARIVARRLRELMESGHAIYHQKEKQTRPVEWRDMVVLLRAGSHKVEVYAKAFAAMDVPLETKRDGFFTAQEVLDLCNLLTILDNPQQDIPLVAVLRSPLAGLSANDLAAVRINAGRGRNIWNALHAYLEAKKENEASGRIQLFLERFRRWRNPRECFSLAQRLERILAETGYAEWLLSQPRGRQRYANVQQLLRVSRQFDEARGESLYLFLRHIQELQESAGDIEPAAVAEGNAVRLMTVHQSKGLEFPVVAVADLGKAFNTRDQYSGILLHEEFGLSAMIQAPGSGQRYPSLPLWLAGREQRLKGLGEEMRVLYVALTRAENLLLLFGSTTNSQVEKWSTQQLARNKTMYPQELLRTKSWLEWVGMHAGQTWPGIFDQDEAHAQGAPFAVQIHREVPKGREKTAAVKLHEAERRALLTRLKFDYAHGDATREPAKTSVSALRNRMPRDEEAAVPKRFVGPAGAIDGRRRGTASHSFLQHVDLFCNFSPEALKTEAERMVAKGLLEKEDAALIDLEAIRAFWDSETGRKIREQLNDVRRELPFTFKLRSEDLRAFGSDALKEFAIPAGEFVVVQGVADLVVLGTKDIWLIDFKTDSVKPNEVTVRAADYRLQIDLYARALEQIYGRPVTRQGLYFLAARKLKWLD